MPRIRSRAWVSATVDEVFAFFDEPRNLARLSPPPATIIVDRVEPDPPQKGSEFTFRYGIGPWMLGSWTVRLVEHVPGVRFRDETVSGPMRRFDHTHAFEPARHRGTWVIDEIDYHVGPDGLLGLVVDAAAGVAMRAIFVMRAALGRRILRA